MPLKLEGGGVVLVSRGWLPHNLSDRTGIEPYETPKGIVDVQGIARANALQAFELGQDGSAAHQEIRQNLDVTSYAKETGLPLQPFVIQQTNDTADKLVRDWPAPTLGVERNYGSICTGGGAWRRRSASGSMPRAGPRRRAMRWPKTKRRTTPEALH